MPPARWAWKLGDVRRVLYRLHEIQGQGTVFVCEGEKDADSLVAFGWPATTNRGGAEKWTDADTAQLREAGVKTVVIFPHNDEPGERHAAQVAQSCAVAGLNVAIIRLSGLAPKGDVADWLAAGGTAEQLADLVRATPCLTADEIDQLGAGATFNTTGVTEQTTKADETLGNDTHLTDAGNAIRLASQHGDELRYVEGWGWLVWDGRRWARDATAETMRRAKATALALYEEAARAEVKERREALAKWAVQSESERALKAMVELAKSEPSIAMTPDQFDQDPWLFNVENGTLDLRTGELRAHRRQDWITKLAPGTYDPAAECPKWYAFLERIFEGKRPLIDFTQRWWGYCLTGEAGEHCLLVQWGTGRNGKTTMVEVMRGVIGDYARSVRAETFMVKRGETPSNDVARLVGARLVTATEGEAGQRLAESLVKTLTGGDRQPARFLYKEFFEFTATYKIVLSTNHRPALKGTDEAIWSRIKLLPFRVFIPEAERDKDLVTTLLATEGPGILRWMVEGCLSWQRDGLGVPEDVRSATDQYRQEQDRLSEFLAAICQMDADGKVLAGELYRCFVHWCEVRREHPWSQTAFGRELEDRGFGAYESHGGRYRKGLLLQPAWRDWVKGKGFIIVGESA
jgi:putative DNA primase/helicase